jgi:hypothetical protein
MPNTAAQLMVDLLFRRSVFFFSRGIREDVFKDLLSSQDFHGEQVKAERTEGDEP